MGTIPPPPPLSFEEFKRRRNAGARTLEELDPDLAAWSRGVQGYGCGVAVCAILFGVMVVALMASMVIQLWQG